VNFKYITETFFKWTIHTGNYSSLSNQKVAYSCLKYTKKRLAAELCPDPLLELMRCARPLATLLGATSEGREGMRRREDEGVYLSINQSINQSIKFICSKCPEIHIKGFSMASRTTRLRPALTAAQLINDWPMKKNEKLNA